MNVTTTAAHSDHTTDPQGRTYDVYGDYRYRVSSTKRGSSALGNCEVCGKPCDVVYIQTQERYVVPAPNPVLNDVLDAEGGFWTQHECTAQFGHETCLRGSR